jgi:adenine/guanine/hypoxanthine permease
VYLEKKFQFSRHKTSLKKELIAGFTTFSTMSYIIVANPLILSAAGMDFSSVMLATIFTSVIAMLIMGLYANYPFALAPGMGMNAYFTYSVVLGMGVPWQTALGIVFITGSILILMWIFGLRRLIIDAIPKGLKVGTTAGIGLFLVFIALTKNKMIVSNEQTIVGLGNIIAPESLLCGLGIVVIAVLLARRVQGAILIGILLNWIIGLGLGLVKWKGIVGLPHFASTTFLAADIKGALNPNLWLIAFSFLFVCLFDSSGSLMGIAHQGRFLDKEGKLPRLRSALLPDGVGTFVGSLLGTSPTVVFIESASGIAAGGRTGLPVILVSILFLVSLFFEPLISSIPFFAIAPVLIIVGAMMMCAITELDWEDPSDYIPCFITVVGIPLTYSIGIGIGFGMILYPICKLFSGRVREVHWLTWILAALFCYKFAVQ